MVEPLECFAPGILDGQVALITGGGTGIGKVTARALGDLGASVVIASRDPEHLEPTAAEFAEAGIEVLSVPTNIRDTASVDALRDAVMERFGRLDILINNVGGQFPAEPRDISDNGWRAVVDLNLNGTWNVTSRFAPVMVDQGAGSIVNVVHIYSFERGGGPFVHSGAARAGVVNMTYTLASTMARAGVRVNAVAPGTVDTLGMQVNEADVMGEIEGMEDFINEVAARIPTGRLAEPDEIASAIVWLSTPAGRWVNGVALRVDGGEYGANWLETFPGRAF